MLLLHYLIQRKKLLLLCIALYSILCHFAYTHLWKDGIRIAAKKLSSSDELLMSYWNEKEFLYRSDITVDSPTEESTNAEPLIAIGSGITSRKLHYVYENNIGEKFQFFTMFLPTFCNTASQHFVYKFYLAYDRSDRVFANQRLRDAFHRQFHVATASGSCSDRGITVNLSSMVECDYAGKPTWAQNDAMLEAYLDNVDYFYRVNDDTRMLTGGWTEKFISTLENYDPPRVGVVGPNNRGDNVRILTYDFVHMTHINIFGFYYPHLFTDWWGDRWMTLVYKPDRSTKIRDVRVIHTLGLGQRYRVRYKVGKQVDGRLAHDIVVVNRYVEAIKHNEASGVKPDGRKVISMSLYGKDPRYTWGVLRNAQLVPVYLPDWRLRVYVAADPTSSELAVPPRIINKLRLLGAEIAYVATGKGMAARNWRLLAANDQHLDYFLVRDADTRLSEREAAAIRDWLSMAGKNGSQSAIIHCIRDHPKHAEQSIVDGLWGGHPRALHQLLNQDITQMMENITSNTSSSVKSNDNMMTTLLNQLVWPAVNNFSYCHDSVSPCDRWTPSTSRRPFSLPRQGQEYIGQKFDTHEELLSKDGDQLKDDVVC